MEFAGKLTDVTYSGVLVSGTSEKKIWMVTVAAFTVSSLTKFTTTLEQAVPKSLVLVIYPVVKANRIILSINRILETPEGMLLYYESIENKACMVVCRLS